MQFSRCIEFKRRYSDPLVTRHHSVQPARRRHSLSMTEQLRDVSPLAVRSQIDKITGTKRPGSLSHQNTPKYGFWTDQISETPNDGSTKTDKSLFFSKCVHRQLSSDQFCIRKSSEASKRVVKKRTCDCVPVFKYKLRPDGLITSELHDHGIIERASDLRKEAVFQHIPRNLKKPPQKMQTSIECTKPRFSDKINIYANNKLVNSERKPSCSLNSIDYGIHTHIINLLKKRYSTFENIKGVSFLVNDTEQSSQTSQQKSKQTFENYIAALTKLSHSNQEGKTCRYSKTLDDLRKSPVDFKLVHRRSVI